MPALTREQIATRVARELKDGYVLGVSDSLEEEDHGIIVELPLAPPDADG